VNVDTEHNVLMSTTRRKQKKVLVHLQSNTTKFAVHTRPTSHQQSH